VYERWQESRRINFKSNHATEFNHVSIKCSTAFNILSLFLETTITMSEQIKYWHVTYNDIHNLIRKVSPKIAADFNPDLLIAIGSFQPPH
jgi:hypothetical protein